VAQIIPQSKIGKTKKSVHAAAIEAGIIKSTISRPGEWVNDLPRLNIDQRIYEFWAITGIHPTIIQN
jgi:hypothetical protein